MAECEECQEKDWAHEQKKQEGQGEVQPVHFPEIAPQRRRRDLIHSSVVYPDMDGNEMRNDLVPHVTHLRSPVILLAATMTIAACNSPARDVLTLPSAPNSTVPLGTDFTLAPGESAAVNGESLQLTFVKVTGDSRCPANVQCVWAGSAVIAVRTASSVGTRELPLETLLARDTATVDGFLVRLVSVTPAPLTTDPIPPASYRATLRITRKN